MDHDEFIGQVQHRARLGSRGDAERATRARLETRAERMADSADSAAQSVAAPNAKASTCPTPSSTRARCLE